MEKAADTAKAATGIITSIEQCGNGLSQLAGNKNNEKIKKFMAKVLGKINGKFDKILKKLRLTDLVAKLASVVAASLGKYGGVAGLVTRGVASSIDLIISPF